MSGLAIAGAGEFFGQVQLHAMTAAHQSAAPEKSDARREVEWALVAWPGLMATAEQMLGKRVACPYCGRCFEFRLRRGRDLRRDLRARRCNPPWAFRRRDARGMGLGNPSRWLRVEREPLRSLQAWTRLGASATAVALWHGACPMAKHGWDEWVTGGV